MSATDPGAGEHGPYWPSDYVPGEPPSCRCGFNGTPEECASFRAAEPDDGDVTCPTCGIVREEPDEPIEPGDYHLIDTTSPLRCPSCGLVPGRDSEGAARVAAARRGAGDVEYAIEGDWLVEVINEHTCGTGPDGYYGAHEPGCGMVPIANIDNLLAAVRREAEVKAGEEIAQAIESEEAIGFPEIYIRKQDAARIARDRAARLGGA